MADELQEVVETIGALADLAEKDKWALAEAVSIAFAEFPAYHRGLTSGLCARLRKSDDLIYGLRDAFDLRNSLKIIETSLSVSHFSALAKLRARYDLTDETCINWVEFATDNCLSVREMSMEIGNQYTADLRKSFMWRVLRVEKDVERLWSDMETVGLPNEIRAATKTALTVLKEWVESLRNWSAEPKHDRRDNQGGSEQE